MIDDSFVCSLKWHTYACLQRLYTLSHSFVVGTVRVRLWEALESDTLSIELQPNNPSMLREDGIGTG